MVLVIAYVLLWDLTYRTKRPDSSHPETLHIVPGHSTHCHLKYDVSYSETERIAPRDPTHTFRDLIHRTMNLGTSFPETRFIITETQRISSRDETYCTLRPYALHPENWFIARWSSTNQPCNPPYHSLRLDTLHSTVNGLYYNVDSLRISEILYLYKGIPENERRKN